MPIDFNNAIDLFMVYDILGDTLRTGPLLWCVDREILENIKDHSNDLILIYRILERYMPSYVNSRKVTDYMMFHDLPEAITGDITKFQGVPSKDKKRVTKEAIDYLQRRFGEIINLGELINGFENRVDIEAKIASMIDSAHSATTFIKYESEGSINENDPQVLSNFKDYPFVMEKLAAGYDAAEIFYDYHVSAINISDEECQRYSISRLDADRITEVIKGFLTAMINRKRNNTLLNVTDTFPAAATEYNPKFKRQ